MNRSIVTLAAFLALSISGCASQNTNGTNRPARPKSSSGQPYLIEGDELKVESAVNLYDVVRIRRPSWLTRTVRNQSGNDAVVVYLDNKAIGKLNILREISVDVAERIEFLAPTEALLRFGPNHGSAAAIVVQVKK